MILGRSKIYVYLDRAVEGFGYEHEADGENKKNQFRGRNPEIQPQSKDQECGAYVDRQVAGGGKKNAPTAKSVMETAFLLHFFPSFFFFYRLHSSFNFTNLITFY